MPAPTRINRPVLWLLLGSLCISFAPIFIRLAEVPPDSAGFYRMLFAALSLALLLRIRGERLSLQRTTLALLILSAVLLSLDFMCWHRSIHAIGPGLSTLLANFQVFFTALLAWVLFRERPSLSFAVAIVIALGGMSLITGIDLLGLESPYRLGILLALATALFYSGYILCMKGALNRQSVSGVATMLVVALTSTVFLGLVSLVGGASFAIPDTRSLLALAGAGLVCTTLGWSLISTALGTTSATITGLFLLLQPALAFVWDVLFFARPTGGHEVAGVLLILSAIYLGSLKPRR